MNCIALKHTKNIFLLLDPLKHENEAEGHDPDLLVKIQNTFLCMF